LNVQIILEGGFTSLAMLHKPVEALWRVVVVFAVYPGLVDLKA
jgi:hypothetical protein